MTESQPQFGQTISHYRILEKLGSGGMGVVYKGEDVNLQRLVALKFLPDELAKKPQALTRFHREAKAISTLGHPNICTIHEFDEQDGMAFIVMEYLAGQTLKQHIGGEALPVDQVLHLGFQIASALEEAHKHGVIHRDLKPSNIMVTSKGSVKVLDFGLAKIFHPGVDTDNTSSLDDTHTTAGTFPYMSPEQMRGDLVDMRTDIWAFGIVLYEMATGRRPFQEMVPARLIDAILYRAPVSPSMLNPAVPPGLESLIFKALDKNPECRYQSARELCVDLHRLQKPGLLISQAPLPHRRGRRGINSIAILPLINTTEDPETEHISDGITENIINSLSQLPKLRVMARSTVFRYKGQTVDPITVGRELNVRAVLMGRLIQRGNVLNVSTELVDVTDGAQIWGEQYSQNLANIFLVQQEIATAISFVLRLKLTGREKQQLVKRHTENREAYNTYLRGRCLASKYTAEGMKKAIEYFHQAIEIDPKFSLAYAGLAMAYWNVSAVQFAPAEVMPKAREAAQKALDIDPQLAESHAAMALVKMAYEWDRAGAESQFKLATQLNPGYATMYQWHGWHLAIMGLHTESIAELKRAQELDPLSEINTYIGLAYYWARKYDIAIEQLQKALELYPDFWLPHLYLGWAQLQQGDMSNANGQLGKAYRLEDNTWTAASLAHAAAVSGEPAQASRLLTDLQQRAVRQFVAPYFVARIFTGLSDQEQAFEWLEKAYEARDECLTWLKVDPTMDSLRADTRYPELLRRLGLLS